jgi:hypothetical protein
MLEMNRFLLPSGGTSAAAAFQRNKATRPLQDVTNSARVASRKVLFVLY